MTGGQKADRKRLGKAERTTKWPAFARTDQSPECLRQTRADDAIVMSLRAAGLDGAAARRGGHGGRGRVLHDDAAQGSTRHVQFIAQRIGAEQAGAWIVAEDIGKRAGVDRIDMRRAAGLPAPIDPRSVHGPRASAGSR